MSKKSRLFMIIAVLAVCFAFLWPSISWYVCTPKEDKVLALSSLENIKNYSTFKANSEVEKLIETVKANPESSVPENSQWLVKQAKKNFKASGEKAPSAVLLKDALNSFGSKSELVSFVEGIYRKKVLKTKDYYKNSVKLGLDLSGGMNVIVKANLDSVIEKQGDAVFDAAALKAEVMSQAVETLTSRIDRFGLSSPTIRQQGEDRIYIELPGSAESDQINSIIQGRGILNFRLVDNEATSNFNAYYYNNPDKTFDIKGNLIDPSIVPEDCEVLGFYTTDSYGLDQREGYLVVKKDVALDGKHIKSADVGAEELTGRPAVTFSLDTEGAEISGKFTSEHLGENLCIVSDNKVKSNATINTAITGGNVQITGFGQREAQNLRKVLQTAWLDVPLSVESQQVIGASLGEKAIRQGLLAVAVGLLSIMVFMLIWYKGSGINACVSQALNLYIMFSILSAFNLTITLPTVAGMILTIGMATDANVIIFERIKEERCLGKDRASSISAGFDNAFWAIMDSNITTFIAAIFMTQLGSGAVQGFAVSLAIGVVSTVFTALVVSRLIFDFQTEVLKVKNISIGWGIK